MDKVKFKVDNRYFRCLSCNYDIFDYIEETGDLICCACGRKHYGAYDRVGFHRATLMEYQQ